MENNVKKGELIVYEKNPKKDHAEGGRTRGMVKPKLAGAQTQSKWCRLRASRGGAA